MLTLPVTETLCSVLAKYRPAHGGKKTKAAERDARVVEAKIRGCEGDKLDGLQRHS